jgi:signal transduction histidine kinase
VILIIVISFTLFFYLQSRTESDIRNGLFNEKKQLQLESTEALTQHIGSDLDLVVTRLYALANSGYLQQGDFVSDQAHKLLEENYDRIDDIIDRLFVLDKDDIISTSLSARGLESFAGVDFSLREWVKETRSNLKPVFSNGFETLGLYRVFITYPIINRDNGEYIGLVGASIPTVNFFGHYGNVYEIDSPFLVAFDKKGTILAIGASDTLVGKNFFGDDVQKFINHNPILVNLTRTLLDGNAGYAVYDYGRGERLTTQYPVFVDGEPIYFIQVVTPTATIYSHVNEVLFAERLKMFSLIGGTIAAVVVLIIFLIKWNSVLGEEVKKRTKELDESNEKLKLHGKMQREFINIAAHELRTPIQPILGLSGVLKSKIKDMEQGELLEVIIRNAKRLQRLTEDVLDVTKIESRSLQLKREQFDINSTIQNIVRDYENRTTILFEKKENPILLQGDKGRITQVVCNLLDNSLKFAKLGRISIVSERIDGKVKVSVKDNGSGIDPDILPRLFSKFATKSSQGTGLGLYISKNIIEAHGGYMWAWNNDEAEKGATFVFSLPLN